MARAKNAQNGILPQHWGPPLWKFLHIMACNYDPKRKINKKYSRDIYRDFFENVLGEILPCRKCRINYKGSFRKTIEKMEDGKGERYTVYQNRESMQEFVYNLHNTVNEEVRVQKAKMGIKKRRKRIPPLEEVRLLCDTQRA